MPISWQVAEFLRQVRDLRAAPRPPCPRCGETHVVRWGSFSGRMRYKCRGCRRTFSDLTGTSLAYTKRIDARDAYLACIVRGDSVRGAARRVGIHKDTAFRWRHRFLGHLRAREAPALTGVVEVLESRFPYSEKGQRVRSGPAQLARASKAAWSPHVRVLICCDRSGAQWSAIKGSRYVFEWRDEGALVLRRLGPPEQRFDGLLSPWLVGTPLLVGRKGALSYLASAATRLGSPYRKGVRIPRSAMPHELDPERPIPWPVHHLENVSAQERRLLAWMERFRGVATKYLENYLAWHRLVDPLEPANVLRRTLRGVVR